MMAISEPHFLGKNQRLNLKVPVYHLILVDNPLDSGKSTSQQIMFPANAQMTGSLYYTSNGPKLETPTS